LDPSKLLLARKKFLKKQQKELEGQNKKTKKKKPCSLVTMKSQVRGQRSRGVRSKGIHALTWTELL
jgi:hypothetical protein